VPTSKEGEGRKEWGGKGEYASLALGEMDAMDQTIHCEDGVYWSADVFMAAYLLNTQAYVGIGSAAS